MGCATNDSACYENEEPARMETVESFSIGVTPVTTDAYARCFAAGACTKPDDGNPNCNWGRKGDHPINCVDWDQAVAFCSWGGGRLPSATEWEYAAKSGRDVIYPWGNDPVSGRRANYCDSNCPKALEPEFLQTWRDHNYIDFNQDDGWAGTSPVGSYPGGATPWGLLDMAGNVFEWTSSNYDASRKEVRGGSWSIFWKVIRASFRNGRPPASRSTVNGPRTGFRCAM